METINAKIAISDDEPEIRNGIEHNIQLVYKDVDIIQFEDAKSLLEYEGEIDIIFLDIQMDEVTGIEAARELRHRGNKAVIIFVTAIEEYVFEAFDVRAFHYLVKPIDTVKFLEVLKNAVAEYDEAKVREAKAEPYLSVKIGNTTSRIYFCEIRYIEVYNRKIIVHKESGDTEFYGKLGDVESRLSDGFVRCHRAYIASLRCVSKYNVSSVILDNGEKLPMSEKRYPEFVRKYMQYTRKLASN